MAAPTLRRASRYRWCTTLLVGNRDGAERLSELGDSVMIAAVADGAELITVVTGEDAPLDEEEIRALVPPGVELEVTPGAPAPWWWLIAAE